MKKTKEEKITLTKVQKESLVKEIQTGRITPETAELLIKILACFEWLNQVIEMKTMSFKVLRRILFGKKTESKRDEHKRDRNRSDDDDKPSAPRSSSVKAQTKEKNLNVAERIIHKHESLNKGDKCPLCFKGKLYISRPRALITMSGQSPIKATEHICEGLRCNTCGAVFYPEITQSLEKNRYDATLAAQLAILRFQMGVPHERLAFYLKKVGPKLPKSTQWEQIEKLARPCVHLFEKLKEEAAKGKVIYNDDTFAKIQSEGVKKLYSTAIYSVGKKKITLFMTGKKHAGRNMNELLDKRPDDLDKVITMNDATTMAIFSKRSNVTPSKCLAHARRKFLDLPSAYDRQRDFVFRLVKIIYKNEKLAKNMSEEHRLYWHQKKSFKAVRRLKKWCERMILDKKVEPNSDIGKSINYLREHWRELTCFMRVAGAPLDNNICERKIKTSIRHRKNSLFYKTENGALVGDIMMSLIQTCLNMKVNPFDYLTAIGRKSCDVFKAPDKWLPWNYETAKA